MTRVIAVDTENTIFDTGNPFYASNRCCVVSYSGYCGSGVVDLEYSGEPYAQRLARLRELIHGADLVVGFNLKYDLHWLRRYGITILPHQKVWCSQLYEYLASAQQHRLDSLEAAASRRGLGEKEKGIEAYWDLGVNTDQVPFDVLRQRALSDAILTEKLGQAQLRDLYGHPQSFRRLVALSNEDLLVLAEMEWNGLKFDFHRMQQEQDEVSTELTGIDLELNRLFEPHHLNWNSVVDRSAALYGGWITQTQTENVGNYKTGPHAGQPRFHRIRVFRQLNRLVEPLHGSKLARTHALGHEPAVLGETPPRSEGARGAELYSTDAQTLPRLKARGVGKTAIGLLQRRGELEKLRGTYLEGFRARAELMGWLPSGIIHGQFNQTTVITGRLSSSRPNLQNLPEDMDKFLITRC